MLANKGMKRDNFFAKMDGFVYFCEILTNEANKL